MCVRAFCIFGASICLTGVSPECVLIFPLPMILKSDTGRRKEYNLMDTLLCHQVVGMMIVACLRIRHLTVFHSIGYQLSEQALAITATACRWKSVMARGLCAVSVWCSLPLRLHGFAMSF